MLNRVVEFLLRKPSYAAKCFITSKVMNETIPYIGRSIDRYIYR